MRVNPGRARLMLRRILSEYPDETMRAAFEIAQGEFDVSSFSPIAMAMSHSDSAILAMADPAATRLPGAIGVARAVSLIDAAFEARLMRQIRLARPERRAAVTHRVLDLVAAAGQPHRAVPLLLPLTRAADDRVRSRATLIVGKWKRDARWLSQFLDDRDARVRANAIEALWGVAEARGLFHSAFGDFNHRVLANAIVGTHMVSGEDLTGKVEQLIVSPSENFRAAGAWAAGECGLDVFREPLRELALRPGPARGAAIRALVKMRRREDR